MLLHSTWFQTTLKKNVYGLQKQKSVGLLVSNVAVSLVIPHLQAVDVVGGRSFSYLSIYAGCWYQFTLNMNNPAN
jgi:hypothetical protein